MDQRLNKELLQAYGFKKMDEKSKKGIEIFSLNKVDIALSNDGSVYYSNMGFDYILKTESDLKKLYKELRLQELMKQHG